MIKNLNDYKNSKIKKELIEIIHQMNNSIDCIKKYANRVEIMESLSILHNARTLFEIELDKMKREIDEKSQLE